jgi:large subunit ribosomal protein L6
VERQIVITLSGADRQVLGETAAKIRGLRGPEPYKGKGIKYREEVIRRKAGKAVGSGSA